MCCINTNEHWLKYDLAETWLARVDVMKLWPERVVAIIPLQENVLLFLVTVMVSIPSFTARVIILMQHFTTGLYLTSFSFPRNGKCRFPPFRGSLVHFICVIRILEIIEYFKQETTNICVGRVLINPFWLSSGYLQNTVQYCCRSSLWSKLHFPNL